MDEQYIPEEILKSITSYIPESRIGDVSTLFRRLHYETEGEVIDSIIERYGMEEGPIHAYRDNVDAIIWLLQNDFPFDYEDMVYVIQHHDDPSLKKLLFSMTYPTYLFIMFAAELKKQGKYYIVEAVISMLSLRRMEEIVESRFPSMDSDKEWQEFEEAQKYMNIDIYKDLFITMLQNRYEYNDRILSLYLFDPVSHQDFEFISRVYDIIGDLAFLMAIQIATDIRSHDTVISLIEKSNGLNYNKVLKHINPYPNVINLLIDKGATNYNKMADKLYRKTGERREIRNGIVQRIEYDETELIDEAIDTANRLLDSGSTNYRALSRFINERLIDEGYITEDQSDLYYLQREFEKRNIEI